MCFRHKSRRKGTSAGTQKWPNSLIGTFQPLISFFSLMACMPWTVCLLHTYTHTHTLVLNDTGKLDSLLFSFPLSWIPFPNLHQDNSRKALYHFEGFKEKKKKKKSHKVKDEGLKENGRVNAAFPWARHFPPFSDFGWQHFTPAPPLVHIHFVSSFECCCRNSKIGNRTCGDSVNCAVSKLGEC